MEMMRGHLPILEGLGFRVFMEGLRVRWCAFSVGVRFVGFDDRFSIRRCTTFVSAVLNGFATCNRCITCYTANSVEGSQNT